MLNAFLKQYRLWEKLKKTSHPVRGYTMHFKTKYKDVHGKYLSRLNRVKETKQLKNCRASTAQSMNS